MNKIRIYGAEFCSYCHKAKDLAESHGIEVEYIDVTEVGNEEHQMFLAQNKFKTIPQIYEWDDEEYQFKRHIGGYDAFCRELS